MRHRHLTDDAGFSPAAIDDIISRGVWKDWAELRQAAVDDQNVLRDIRRVCEAYVSDPCEQRHHFWMRFVRDRLRTA